VTMLQICPKLQTLSISKVCWPRRCTFIGFCWFFFFILLKYFYKSYCVSD
jgi:hypothetical protein